MSERLAGKVCIITGGARGIGATTARIFAREGASVVLGDVKDDLGESVVNEIRAFGKAAYVHCDVTREDDCRELVNRAQQDFGTVHVLFNNAGTAIPGKLDQLTCEQWDLTYNVNVRSMFFCSKYAIPVMRTQKMGVIINMSSESGLIGFPMHPAYCSSKAAVINLTRSMAIGHACDGIRVNCICPGTIPTPLYHEFMNALPNDERAEVVKSLTDSHPLGLGSEEDVAYAALYLASDESRYMTGAPLIIDGGLTAI